MILIIGVSATSRNVQVLLIVSWERIIVPLKKIQKKITTRRLDNLIFAQVCLIYRLIWSFLSEKILSFIFNSLINFCSGNALHYIIGLVWDLQEQKADL